MNAQVLTALSVVLGPDDDRSGDPPLSVPSAVAILAALDTPYRLTWFGLLALVRARGRRDLPEQLLLERSLVRSLLDRRTGGPDDLDDGAVDRFLEIAEQVAERDPHLPDEPDPGEEHPAGLGGELLDALAALIGLEQAETLSNPGCRSGLRAHDGRSVLVVRGDDRYRGEVEKVGSSIQPINWPLCNEQFAKMSVVDGSYVQQPPRLDKGLTYESYDCRYVETVNLTGLDPQRFWATTKVVTCLGAHHWEARDASGRVVEIGMEYRLLLGGDGRVVVDQGYAIVTDDGGGYVRMRSEKVIAFEDDRVLRWFELPFVAEVFCVAWNHQFDITIDDCSHRLSPEAAKERVHRDSDRAGEDPVIKPIRGPIDPARLPKAGRGDHCEPWLSQWIDDAADYWDHALGIMARECTRLEQRRSSSDVVSTEALFYDALEVWEANRGSLNEGLDLTARFMSHRPREGERPVRPRVDDVELRDDLDRQREEFVRSRTRDYLGLGGRAAAAMEGGEYERADLVSDSFELWGMWARDVGAAWTLGARSVMRWAEDGPVPTGHHRRVTVKVDIGEDEDAGDRAVGCTRLVSDPHPETGEVSTIGPAEIELRPNPVPPDKRKVKVSVSRAHRAGTYRGALLVHDADPEDPFEVPFEIAIEPEQAYERK